MKTLDSNKTKRPVKTAGYSFAKQQARRNKRRYQAEARAALFCNCGSASYQPRGLREQILLAPTVEIVKSSFDQVRKFLFVSFKTYRRCERAAAKRIADLTEQNNETKLNNV